jgi:ABC-type transporter Mla subunit MlaD
MPDLLAKGVAVTVAALLAIVIGILVVTSRPPAGAQTVTAEFDNAFPLIEGMYVRVDGAIAGSVGSIDVNDEGNAEVDLILNDSIEPASSDATAAIRQQDTTGDSYVAFDPGDSGEPLPEEGIVCADFDTCEQTLVAPASMTS